MEFAKSSSLWDGFLSSLSMIIVSEIGDKTFFIACLMAMRHPRLTVYLGAISALAAMTVLSALMGVVVPTLLSVYLTQMLAAVLFLVFGGKILYDELVRKKAEDEESEDEMAEAAAALRRRDPSDPAETGSVGSSVYASAPARRWRRLLNPVMVEAFTLTFVAEWGDRSQLATIALAAAKNPYAVTVGGVLGHAICTGGAVLCGNLIAQRVSMKTVNVVGGLLFIFFGAATLYELLTRQHDIEKTHKIPASNAPAKFF
ncbi:putative membrane protein [Leptomonas pyrrhocoris]|uniref:GDT1 family protein n=1 Tax=Leptomonas pyrrhocoris TaxID=157538 RepID=A0A0M9G5L7_LEPPY|nr:putative membrane protein [Leptomonas pyrrhocoris]KPA82646.1 putative membrane protein [Leptomonas pyrrhocoris]|eukprot:XP_015661085.1 putative membrane protein [Leptomonas pyrrhocoris]